MKRYVGIVVAVVLIVCGLFILTRILVPLKPIGQGALQVTSNIKSDVKLNGKSVGKTPLCKCTQGETLPSGEYTIELIPDDKSITPYTVKARVEPGVLTAVERTFLPGSLASSYILTLEKINSSEAQLFVQSLPDGAMVALNGSPQSVTPFLAKSIPPSEHEIEIQKAGFAKKTLKVRTVLGYKLVAQIILGTELGEDSALSTLQPSFTPTPTASAAAQVKIKSTPTGFLRVRDDASLAGNEIGRVLPGEAYPLLDEKPDWYKIRLKTNEEGWISSGFADKTTSP